MTDSFEYLTVEDVRARLADDDAWRRLYEQRWCAGPAIFPFRGRDHLVPCTLGDGHDGPCVPAQHQRDHDCDRNGCPQ